MSNIATREDLKYDKTCLEFKQRNSDENNVSWNRL